MKPPAVASPIGAKRLQAAFYSLGLFVLLTLTLYFGHAVFVPLALSALFAFILSTPAEWVEKHWRVGRVASVLLVALLAFGVLAAVGTLAAVQLRGLATDLPKYEANINRKMEPVFGLLARLKTIEKKMEDVAPEEAKPDEKDQPQAVTVEPPGSGGLSWLPTLARPLVEILVNGVLVLVLTVFFLMQRETFRDKLIRLAGRSRLTSTTRALGDAAGRVGKYLLLQLATNAALGVVIGTILYFMGVPFAPLWGLLVTVLRFVPYIGFWMAALSAAGVSAAVSPGWTQPALVLGLFLVVDGVLTNVVEPLIFSHGTGVSAVALLVAAVFWAALWGPVGLLLSTPLTVCLAVLGKHVPALGFLAVLLGDDEALDAAGRYYNRLLARDYDEAAILVEEYSADHPPAALYDEVILPALAQVKTDREQQDVTADEEKGVYDATRDLLDGVEARIGEQAPADGVAGRRPPVKVIGCPVWGEADVLGLRMLGHAIRPAGGEVVVTSQENLADEVKKAEAGGKPVVVCLATLSPGGLVQGSTVLTQVRQKSPKVKLLVGRWGQTGDTAETDKYLRKAGADEVGWSLRETIGQLVPAAEDTAAGKKGKAGKPAKV